MSNDDVREIILDTTIVSLEAQLRAVKRLKGPAERQEPRKRGMSQINMAYDILQRAKCPLHVAEIIDRVERTHGVRIDRESIVSALSKKVLRLDRFARVAKNTFGLREEEA